MGTTAVVDRNSVTIDLSPLLSGESWDNLDPQPFNLYSRQR